MPESIAKIFEKQNASQFPCLTIVVFSQCFCGKRIEFARSGIRFNLRVPSISVESGIPATKLGKLCGW